MLEDKASSPASAALWWTFGDIQSHTDAQFASTARSPQPRKGDWELESLSNEETGGQAFGHREDVSWGPRL